MLPRGVDVVLEEMGEGERNEGGGRRAAAEIAGVYRRVGPEESGEAVGENDDKIGSRPDSVGVIKAKQTVK